MLRSLYRALGDLFAPRIAGVLALSALLSAACFFALWWGLDAVVVGWLGYDAANAPWWLAWLGGSAVLLLAWFTFPLVACAFVALFLERVARSVHEDRPTAAHELEALLRTCGGEPRSWRPVRDVNR